MKIFIKNNTLFFYLLFILNVVILTSFLLLNFVCNASAKSKNNISFVKKYQSVTLNNQLKYKIKNLKQTDTVSFFVSDSSLALINKKSGLLTPKKAGRITVTAKVYNKKKILLKTLHNTIMIKKKPCIPNAFFKIKKNINSWDFTFTLSCSRILLKSEISSDILTISPIGKNIPKLTASFSKLSSDGKKITYVLSPSSQKKLCPGDSSMNGTYLLKSSSFSQKLTLTYKERLTQNTISGFVLKEDGNPIKNALLTLKKQGNLKQICYSDSNGHYSFQNISSSDSLIVSKDGFQTKEIKTPTLSKKGTTCENIILRSSDNISAAINFFVTDKKNIPISDASIYLLSGASTNAIETINNNTSAGFIKDDTILYFGKTDINGNLLISSFDKMKDAPCSYFDIDNDSKISYSSKSRLLSTNTIKLSNSILNTTDSYTIIVQNFLPDNITNSYQTQLFTFSFSDLSTEYAEIHICLSKNISIILDNIIIYSANSLFDCNAISISLYHPKQKNSFYQLTLSNETFTQDDNKIIVSASLPISIPDGTYYISVKALSKTDSLLYVSSVLPVTITDSKMFSENILLEQPRFARALTYFKETEKQLNNVSFSLYQKCGIFYFHIKNIKSNSFQKNNNGYYTTSLLLSGLHEKCEYILLPASDSFQTKNSLPFSITNENSYLSEGDAWYSSSPAIKLECISISKNNAASVYFPNNNSHYINEPLCHSISQDFIRSSSNYPNCVIAYYKTNGTLLSLSLTLSPINDNTTFSFDNSAIITDIYINKKILITSQDFLFKIIINYLKIFRSKPHR